MFIELENYFLKILDYCLLITLINRLKIKKIHLILTMLKINFTPL